MAKWYDRHKCAVRFPTKGYFYFVGIKQKQIYNEEKRTRHEMNNAVIAT
jgi:hypothetical protein